MEGPAQAAKGCWAAMGTGVFGAKACSLWPPRSQALAGETLLIPLPWACRYWKAATKHTGLMASSVP